MTDTLLIDEHLQTEDQLFILLRNKKYKVLLHFIDTNYRLKFRTELSGESFESCIDWCAQNAGGVENARQVLLHLFAKFYRQLPSPVKTDLAYLAEEIGYISSSSNIYRLKDCSKELAAGTKTAFNVMVKQVQDYVAEMRLRKKPQASVRFHQVTVPASMRMQNDEQFILDVRNAAEPSLLGDNPSRAGGPQSDLRLSA
jgi:hypothetical protein